MVSFDVTITGELNLDLVLYNLSAGQAHQGDQQVCADLRNPHTAANFQWCLLEYRDGTYLREQLRIRATDRDLGIAEVRLLDFQDARAHVEGTVEGSLVVDGQMFFGFEHPLSWSKVNAGRLQTDISRVLPSQKNQFVTYSAVIGTAQAGQLRGAILAYLEDERPHAFEPFLHYNSWYDIGYENRYDEVAILDWQADRVGIGSLEAFEVHTFESDASAMHP